MEKTNRNEETEIDLMKLIRAVWAKKWIIILAAIGGALLAALYTIFLVTPTYRAEFQAYIYNYQDTSSVSYISSSDYSASSYIATTYANILTNRTVIDIALDSTNLDYTYEDVSESITAEVVDDTQIITVYVTMEDPEEAYILACALEDTGPDALADIVEGSSMKIVSTAQLPKEKYSPSTTKNTIIGALIGFIIAAVVVIIIALTDDTVKEESTLEETFGIHVIGSIPNFYGSDKGSSYYYYSSGSQKSRSSGSSSPHGKSASLKSVGSSKS